MYAPLRAISNVTPSPGETRLAIVQNTAEGGSSPQFNSGALDRACNQILLVWRKYVSEVEAQAQADEFRARCRTLADHFVLSPIELEATLDAVSAAMSERP